MFSQVSKKQLIIFIPSVKINVITFSKDDFMKNSYNFSDKPDLWLLCSCVLAALFGIFVINSATFSLSGHWRFVIVQSVAFVLGLIAMYAVILFKYTLLEKFRYLVFSGGIGMLILVLVMGKISHGTQGWIELGPISIQPSEPVHRLLRSQQHRRSFTYLHLQCKST